MFSSSSQQKHWTFSGTTELNRLRSEANQKHIKTHQHEAVGNIGDYFLSSSEEMSVCRHFEYKIKHFCAKFQPPMPIYVVGTSVAYFKRFYLHNSVMEYHPNEIMYTCMYLACKVEEFNVSIMQFVANMQGDREQAADVILSQEMLVMMLLHYHLVVYNPFRALEGLLVDIKQRCASVEEAERLRKGADEFLDRSMNTDVCLIFAPSQIALAAVLSSASKIGLNLDSYVANSLVSSGDKDIFMKTIENVKRIRYMLKNQEPLDREEVRKIEGKLDICRNQEHNPLSDEYKQKLQELFEDDEERQYKKQSKRAEESRKENEDLLGL